MEKIKKLFAKLKTLSKKTIILIVIGVVAVTSVILFPTLFVRRTGTLSNTLWRPEDTFEVDETTGEVAQAAATLRKEPGKEFVIVNFTDLQINAECDMAKTGSCYKTMKKVIDQKKPDLITLSGDIAWAPIVMQCYQAVIRTMDGFGIPWTLCFGNHDEDWNADGNYLGEMVQKSKYGIFKKSPRDVHGISNFFINIVERQSNGQDKVVHTLFMLDSEWGGFSFTEEQKEEIRDYNFLTQSDMDAVKANVTTLRSTYFPDVPDYAFDNYFYVNPMDEEYLEGKKGSNEKGDYIQIGAGDGNVTSTQIFWYEWVVKQNTQLNIQRGFIDDPRPESTCIFHIAFFEFYEAYKEWLIAIRDGDTEKLAEMQPEGRMRFQDPLCSGAINFHFFDSIKENGTKNVIVGHDHINDFSLVYQGVRLTYSVKTGNKVYHDETGTMNGGTRLTISDNGKATSEQVYIDNWRK